MGAEPTDPSSKPILRIIPLQARLVEVETHCLLARVDAHRIPCLSPQVNIISLPVIEKTRSRSMLARLKTRRGRKREVGLFTGSIIGIPAQRKTPRETRIEVELLVCGIEETLGGVFGGDFEDGVVEPSTCGEVCYCQSKLGELEGGKQAGRHEEFGRGREGDGGLPVW